MFGLKRYKQIRDPASFRIVPIDIPGSRRLRLKETVVRSKRSPERKVGQYGSADTPVPNVLYCGVDEEGRTYEQNRGLG